MQAQDISEAEANDVKRARQLRAGQWQEYTAAPPVLHAAGPAQPTRDELRQLLAHDAPLSLLVDPPVNTALLCWALEEAGYRTTEPPRSEATSFWHRRIGYRAVTAFCHRWRVVQLHKMCRIHPLPDFEFHA